MRRHPRCGVGWKGSNRPLMWRFVGCSKFGGRDALAPVFGGSRRDKGQIALGRRALAPNAATWWFYQVPGRQAKRRFHVRYEIYVIRNRVTR